MIAIRRMAASELDRIGEIDRSEHVTQEYSYRRGSLRTRAVDLVVPTWSRSGDHEHSVRGRIEAWQPTLDRGGTLVGAFDADRLVGFAIYRPDLSEDMANLSALYVSRSHRRKASASLLAALASTRSRYDKLLQPTRVGPAPAVAGCRPAP